MGFQVHIRGGGIIPIQRPALTTKATRQNPYTLLVALSVFGAAEGFLYLDDGDSLDVQATGSFTYLHYAAKMTSGRGILVAHVVHDGYSAASRLDLDRIVILGVGSGPSGVLLNGTPVAFAYNAVAQTLTMSGLSVAINFAFSLTWR